MSVQKKNFRFSSLIKLSLLLTISFLLANFLSFNDYLPKVFADSSVPTSDAGKKADFFRSGKPKRSGSLNTFNAAKTVDPSLTNSRDGLYKEDRVIVKFKDGVSKNDADSVLSAAGMSERKSFKYSKAKVIGLPSGMEVDGAVKLLEESALVEYAEPDFVMTINQTIPNDARFNALWGMHNTGQTGGIADADIDAPEAWDIDTGTGSVVVAVVDTGIDYFHEDLVDNLWINTGEIDGNGIDDDGNGYIDDIYGINSIVNDGNPYDDHGHGTHVSGTIAGRGNNDVGVAGVAWGGGVHVMALKFLDSYGSGYTSDAVQCIDYIITMFDAGVNVRVSSNSWGGGGYSTTLYDAIAELGARDILFVAAAGNSGSNTDLSPHYPSSYDLDNIIAVAATDDEDALASWSSFGPTSVDVAAPGVSVVSSLPGYAPGSSDYIPAPGDIFYDDVESGTGIFTPDTPWDITNTNSNSPSNSWTDSPGGSYSNYTNSSLTSAVVDLSAYTTDDIRLGFSAWADIETGYDKLYVEVSGDNGTTWSQLGYITGHYTTWTVYNYPIPVSVRTNQFMFRLRFYTDYSVIYDGIYVDDIGIGIVAPPPPPSVFFDDVESGAGSWVAEAPWAITSTNSKSPSNSWTDSPGGDYAVGDNVSLTSGTFDLTTAADPLLAINFYASIYLESYWDFLFVEVSADNGTSWTTLGSLTGYDTAWNKYTYLIPNSFRTNQFKMRFRLYSDPCCFVYDGVYIDDISIGAGEYSNNYGSKSGTSMATPHVAGLAALVQSYRGNLSSSTVRDLINVTVDPIPSLSGKILTGGRINAYNALMQDPNDLPPMAYSINPSQVPVGATVMINGARFGTTQGSVTFPPGVTGQVVSWSDTSVSVIVPAGAKTGYVTLTTSGAATANGIYLSVGSFLQQLATITQGVDRAAVSSVGNKVYVLGGYTNGGMTASGTVQIYDTNLNYWYNGSSQKPTPTANASCAAIGDKIYVVAGYNSGSLNVLEVYDTVTDTWDGTRALYPLHVSGARVVALNGKIYGSGGSGGSVRNSFYVYDPATNAWSALASMNYNRAYHGTGVIDGKIYVFGGYNGTDFIKTTEVYDPATNIWTVLSPMNTARYDFGGVSFNGKLYAFGGNAQSFWSPPYLQDIEAYDPATDTWEPDGHILNIARQGLRATRFGTENVFILGGYNGGYSSLGTNEVLGPELSPYSPVLISSLSVSPAAGITPLASDFAVTASGGSGTYTYSWDFGDGSSLDTTQNPSHVYTTAGTYSVSVTVTDASNANNSAIGQLSVLVSDPPAPYSPVGITLLSASPSSGHPPLSTDFAVTASGGSGTYTYSWDFGDGSSLDTTQNPNHVYTATGTYSVSVTVTDAADTNNSTTGQLSVIVSDAPVVPVSVSTLSASPSTGITPLVTAFNVEASGGSGIYIYSWDLGDGSPPCSEKSPGCAYITAGTYNVTVTVTDAADLNNSTTGQLSVTVVDPTAPIVPVGITTLSAAPASGIAPLSTALNVEASGGSGTYTYSWDFGDSSTISTEKSPSHIYTDVGTYSVSVTVTDETDPTNSSTGQLSVMVVEPAQPYIPVGISSITALPSAGEAPLLVEFGVVPTGGSGLYTYSWDFGDGSSLDTSQNPSHIYTNEGSYTVTATVSNASDPNDFTTVQLTVMVIAAPETFSIGLSVSPASGVAPVEMLLTISIICDVDGPFNISCDFGDGAIKHVSANDKTVMVSHTYTEAGSYKLWVGATADGGAGSKMYTVQSSVSVLIMTEEDSTPAGGFVTGGGGGCFIASASYENSKEQTFTDKIIKKLTDLLK